MDEPERLREALAIAIDVIEAYDLEIRNVRVSIMSDGLEIGPSPWGATLAEHGFCQGSVFREAIPAIRTRMEEGQRSGTLDRLRAVARAGSAFAACLDESITESYCDEEENALAAALGQLQPGDLGEGE